MSAIISEKFRIFNANQFLESLTEGANDTSADRSRMYFFVGRSDQWDSYLEIYNANGTAFAVGDEVYDAGSGGATAYGSTTWKATVRKVNPNSLLVHSPSPASGTPTSGNVIKGYAGAADTGAEAKAGVHRIADETNAPAPLDNQEEKFKIYEELIAAKRVESSNVISVTPRYNWNTVLNPKFDMYKPDYTGAPASGGTAKAGATGANTLSAAKFYVMNSSYEVFKCLYNKEDVTAGGGNASDMPTTANNYANGVYTGPTAAYRWKYLYTMTTQQVMDFLSSDFMPIGTYAGPAAVDGAIDTVLIKDVGLALPANKTGASALYAPILGDGTGGIVKIETDGTGALTSSAVEVAGTGYTYGSVALVTGTGTGAGGDAYGVFSDSTLATSESIGGSARGALEVIIPPEGGHGANLSQELNAKRVMVNVRLTYAEGQGDFPVDNDFRRIGLIKDPLQWGSTNYATANTLSGVYAVRVTGTGLTSSSFGKDNQISQTVTGGTAKGTVVSWKLDDSSTTDGILKYYQSPQSHTDSGVVRAFASDASNAITDAGTAVSVTVNTSYGSTAEGVTFTAGLATPEIKSNSGELVYIENRRLITRAADQIEDIKLVIEF